MICADASLAQSAKATQQKRRPAVTGSARSGRRWSLPHAPMILPYSTYASPESREEFLRLRADVGDCTETENRG